MSTIVLRKRNGASKAPQGPSPLDEGLLLAGIDEALEERPEKAVLCLSCEHVLTDPKLACEPYGQTFRNAVGFSYCIYGYADAPGTVESGVPTTDYTWFAGYAWSFAHCGGCGVHLGWWYSGPSRFVGLIATRIIR